MADRIDETYCCWLDYKWSYSLVKIFFLRINNLGPRLYLLANHNVWNLFNSNQTVHFLWDYSPDIGKWKLKCYWFLVTVKIYGQSLIVYLFLSNITNWGLMFPTRYLCKIIVWPIQNNLLRLLFGLNFCVLATVQSSALLPLIRFVKHCTSRCSINN